MLKRKATTQKAEEAAAEAPKTEEASAPKAEEAAAEAPKAEDTSAPKVEEASVEAPKAEAASAPNAEEPDDDLLTQTSVASGYAAFQAAELLPEPTEPLSLPSNTLIHTYDGHWGSPFDGSPWASLLRTPSPCRD